VGDRPVGFGIIQTGLSVEVDNSLPTTILFSRTLKTSFERIKANNGDGQ